MELLDAGLGKTRAADATVQFKKAYDDAAAQRTQDTQHRTADLQERISRCHDLLVSGLRSLIVDAVMQTFRWDSTSSPLIMSARLSFFASALNRERLLGAVPPDDERSTQQGIFYAYGFKNDTDVRYRTY